MAEGHTHHIPQTRLTNAEIWSSLSFQDEDGVMVQEIAARSKDSPIGKHTKLSLPASQ